MPKHRSFDPSLWRHPFFERHPWFVRDLFMYLFTAAADDEGRFKADPLALLSGAFPRRYPVEEEDITQALEALADGGLVCLYGDGNRYGFLTGWYEHQRIDKRWRDESSLPPPPVAPASWEAVDGIYTAYCEARGIAGKTSYRNAVAWYQAGSPPVHETPTEDPAENHARISGESPDNLVLDVDVDVDVDSDLEHPSAQTDVCAPAETASQPATPAKRTRKARPAEDVQADIDAIRAELSPAYLPHVDSFIDLCASHNKSGGIAKTRELTETAALAALIRESELTVGAFAHGVSAAVHARGRNNGKPGAPSVNYVKSAAEGYEPGGDFAGGRRPGAQCRLTAEDEAILRDEQRAREARRNGAP